jgi:hypothetical protein
MELIYDGFGTDDTPLTSNTNVRGTEATNTDNATLGQVITYIKKIEGTLVGSVYCKLFTDNATLTVVETSSKVLTDSDLTISYQEFTFPFTNSNVITNGYRVGIYYNDSGTVYMQKTVATGGSPPGKYDALHYDSGTWGGQNADHSYNMDIYTGSISSTRLPPSPIVMQL